MKHAIILEGYGCRLRPVELQDAQAIIDLRRSTYAAPYIGNTSPDLALQKQWIENYFERDGDYYWIVEDITKKAEVIGTIGLYDIVGKEGIPGRWIQSPSATFFAVVPPLLVYDFAYDTLGLERLVVNVVSTNKKVLKFHRLLGAREFKTEEGAQMINGHLVNFIWFETGKAEWQVTSAKWKKLIQA